MRNCKINFNGASNRLGFGLYNDLLKSGVSCTDLDQGYNVTNYAGIHCSDKKAKSCVKSKGDGIVNAEEVIEYTLDRYEQYRQVIEGHLGSPLPWLLDDFNPITTFDAEVREKVQAAITELKRIIAAKGIKEGTEEYKEMLAVGLHWFVTVPPIDNVSKVLVMAPRRYPQLFIDGIKKDGLEEFKKYLEKNGGLRVEGDYLMEYSAIEALRAQKGACTELSKILFAVLRMVGLQPMFVNENLSREARQSSEIKKAIKDMPIWMDHSCVGLVMHGRLRLLDPSLVYSDADYKYYTPLALSQYLSDDYSNRGNAWNGKGEFDKAIGEYSKALLLNPNDARAYSNRGIAWLAKGEFDRAIEDSSKSIAINPNSGGAYANRGNAWREKGELDKAIGEYSKAISLNSRDSVAYSNRGIAWAAVGQLDRAIADFSKAISVNSNYAIAYLNRGIVWIKKGKLDNSIADHSKALEIDPYFAAAYSSRGVVWAIKGELDRASADFSKAISINPNFDEAYAGRATLRMHKEEFKGALDDFAKFIQLTRLDFGKLATVIASDLTPFWQKDSNKMIAISFDDDVNANIAEVEARLILSYSLWQSGVKEDAVEQFKAVVEIELTISDKPSESTKTFLRKIFDAMPETMRQDKRVGEVLKPVIVKIK